MNLQKLSPWNWFKSEARENTGSPVPVTHAVEPSRTAVSPLWQMHRELDRWMDDTLRQFGMPTFGDRFPSLDDRFGTMSSFLRPSVDIAERDNEYRISVEVPGVEEKDIKLSLDDHRLMIEGEKRQESDTKEDRYQRIERVYGSFRRVLDLPEDAKVEDIKATFGNGVLTVTLPRDTTIQPRRREIPIQPQ
ncbi:heat-shock protein Hsp20 [Litchfieldella qijiaojingensis]|uniref:Heat-shock protein Hsp20 n=1 Tax=Litchfieldella qijiaojingensis TaxID=980347 RepID=A0ABQ2YX12_9GAMM|nr:Hsp20/alpha crystallin family protein [Halomonas qijiaojingensis]GGX96633.1 heat-shock protein Hsp20 [Halomonas qijiaojingensis]